MNNPSQWAFLDSIAPPRPERSKRAQAAFESQRDKTLRDREASTLTRARLLADGGRGFTIDELAERTIVRSQATGQVLASVSARTIAKMEAGEPASDEAWNRVADAVRRLRKDIDDQYVV